MSEYIEREALRAEAIRLTGGDEFVFGNCFPYWQFSKSIKEAPAADVAPVVHGEWEIAVNGEDIACSVCGGTEPWVGTVDDDLIPFKSDYCPNCGALMDGGEKHE